MRPSVCLQAGEVEVWRFVNVPAIFRPQRYVSCEGIVGATPINECSPSLKRCTGEIAGVAGRIKYQRSAAAQHIGLQSGNGWKLHDGRTSECVNVGFDAPEAATDEALRIPIEAIVRFRRDPTGKVVAITNQKSSGVVSLIPDSIAVAVFGEEPRALNTDFRASFLRDRSHRQSYKTQNRYRHTFD